MYLSSELPPEVKNIGDNLKLILKEYGQLNPKNLSVSYTDPNKDAKARDEATKYGINPIQFSTAKADKIEVQNGYFGVVMVYGSQQQILTSAGDVGNLEYYLDSAIKKLTEKKSKGVTIATGNGVLTPEETQYFLKYLGDNYSVGTIDLSKDEAMPTSNNLLLLLGPNQSFSASASARLSNWISGKRPTLLFARGVTIDQNLKGIATPPLGIEGALQEAGIILDNKLVLDSAASIATFRTQSGSFMTQYPFWVQIGGETINQNSPPLAGIQTLLLPWPTALSLEGKAKVLFYSSPKSWTTEATASLSPMTPWKASGNVGKKPLGAINTETARLAVVSNAGLLQDQFVVNNQENLALAFNLIDYLLQDDSLLAIRTKTIQNPPLLTLEDNSKQMIRISILVLPLVFLLIGGGINWMVRKKYNASFYV